jgi:hypothetical protein
LAQKSSIFPDKAGYARNLLKNHTAAFAAMQYLYRYIVISFPSLFFVGVIESFADVLAALRF